MIESMPFSATITTTVPSPIQPSVPQVPRAPAAPGSDAQGATGGGERPVKGKVIINGTEVRVEGSASDGATGAGVGFPLPSDIPPGVQSIATTAIVSFALMIAAFPVFGLLKALVNRRAAAPALPSRDTTDRLQRIEAAVDAMAVEVERISEGQRFVTRALTERSSTSPS